MAFVSPRIFRLSLVLAAAGCAPAASDDKAGASTKLALGSATAMRQRVHAANVPSLGRYSLPTPTSATGPIETIVRDFDEGPGWFSMGGRVSDSDDSQFILKGNGDSFYGWVVYKDRNLAYEYTTNLRGEVEVQQVPVSKIFAVCNAPPRDAFGPPSAPDPTDVVAFDDTVRAGAFPAHIGTYPAGSDVLKLQSRPGVTKVWFINFADTMNGSEPKSGHTKADVWQTWAIMSATLYPFNVNVTTDAAVYAAAGVANSGCSKMIYAGIGDSSSCALNIFGTRTCCDNHLYTNGYATGRIANHEAGHGWGLSHDGGSDGGEYFNGFSDFQWTPLMGNIWPGDRWAQALYHYSKGEYTSATQKQDDLAIVSKTVPYMDDDIPDTTPLILDGTMVRKEMNWGQIGRNTDSDSWTFRIADGGGHVMLKIDRIEDRGGGMLDVDASLVDSTGKMVAQNNAMVARSATLNTDLAAGAYTLVIKGGAEGTPAHGFSNYSSIGLYGIEGTITGGTGTGAGGAGGTSGSGGAGGATTTGSGGRGGATGTGTGGGNGGNGSGGRTGTGGREGGSGGAPGSGGATNGSGGATATGGATGSGGAPIVGSGGATVPGSGGQTGTPGSGGSTTPGGSGGAAIPDAGAPGQNDPGTGCACSAGAVPRSGNLAFWLVAVGAIFRIRRRRHWNYRPRRGCGHQGQRRPHVRL